MTLLLQYLLDIEVVALGAARDKVTIVHKGNLHRLGILS